MPHYGPTTKKTIPHGLGSRMPDFLHIENDGPRIVTTNYWRTPYDRAGAFYLSFNARAARLLVPSVAVDAFTGELRGADHVDIDLGPCPVLLPGLPPHAYRLVFDDHTDTPFFLVVGPGQFDRVIPAAEHGAELHLTAYGPGPRVLATFLATFRRVAAIPEILGGAK